jgi:hypothetical protein
MAGPIGMTSGKFALVGAVLLLHGRVDDRNAVVALAPGAAESVASAAGPAERKVHLRAESFRVPVRIANQPLAGGAAVRLGQDFLNAYPVEIDFPHQRIEPLTPGEARGRARSFRAIPLTRNADGSRSLTITIGDATAVRARLDLTSERGVTALQIPARVALGLNGIDAGMVEGTTGPGPVLGLGAFRNLRVRFDLAHDRIWVRP